MFLETIKFTLKLLLHTLSNVQLSSVKQATLFLIDFQGFSKIQYLNLL